MELSNILFLVIIVSLIMVIIYLKIKSCNDCKELIKNKESILNNAGSQQWIKDMKSLAQDVVDKDMILQRRNKIFEILIQSSKEFLCSLDANGGKIERLLKGICDTLLIERGYMYKCMDDYDTDYFERMHDYRATCGSQKKCDHGILKNILIIDHPKLFEILKSNKIIPSLSQLSNDEQVYMKSMNINSLLYVPIFVDSVFTGFIGFESKREIDWLEMEIQAISVVSEIIAAWSGRRHENEKLLEIISQSQIR